MGAEIDDALGIFRWDRVAYGIGDVDYIGARCYDGLHDFAEIRQVGARRIFGRKLNIGTKRLGIATIARIR
jgi:hypothetical protein